MEIFHVPHSGCCDDPVILRYSVIKAHVGAQKHSIPLYRCDKKGGKTDSAQLFQTFKRGEIAALLPSGVDDHPFFNIDGGEDARSEEIMQSFGHIRVFKKKASHHDSRGTRIQTAADSL